MFELVLEWQEDNLTKSFTILGRDGFDRPNSVSIGRDPKRCDLILTNPTVSALHVKIAYSDRTARFYLSSLRETNPPVVDGCKIARGETPLKLHSQIYLGEVLLKVTSIRFKSPPRIIIPPSKPQANNLAAANQGYYQLKCSSCGRICPYDWIDLGCQWCGTSLAAAASIIIPPKR
jgi:hypothetical protein